ncbi:MAG: sigma 54-interacting transcriptional regulator [Candidatus Latescibacteria bacterium]|nr:sigma 54-interacting transcriptional regulator [Candidatus Latescibacterota bacterium]
MDDVNTVEMRLWRDGLALISKPQALQQGLREMAEMLVGHFAVDFCAIYLLDRRTDELVLHGRGGQESYLAMTRLRVGQGITGMAAYQGKLLQVAHMQRDPRSVHRQGGERYYQSIVALPLVEGEALLGALNLQSGAVRHFSQDEIEVLNQVVRPIIIGMIRTAQAFEDMGQRTSEVQALNELGQAMNSGLGLDESIELIATKAAEALSAKGSIIRLMVEDGSLAQATVVAVSEEQFDARDEKRIAEYVAATGEPIVIDDLRAIKYPGTLGASLVCIPLVLEERVVGTLTLFDKITPLGAERRLFSMDDLNMLFALSSQLAAEIEDIRLTGRLQELVRTEKQQAEELRQLYNRSRALLESISDGLLAVDREGVVVEANTVAHRIFGQQQRALKNRPIDELAEDKPPLREWLRRGEQFSQRVITLNTAAGRVAAMANLQPILDAGSQASGAVLTFREMGEVGRLVNRVIGVQRTFAFEDIIGSSPIIEKTKELARIAAGTSSNILIQGETGTGKEVFAQAIHNASAYSEGPFLAVNCAALPRDLIESELFGYVEGAFTGASKKGRLGKFELASGGTLFLDEIGEIPPEVQVKLLRVLQEKAIVRVGGDRTIPVNCRMITATNRDLHRAVGEQKFRQDLLYRLDVITIEVPPLRERRGDIPLFAARFIENFARRNSKAVEGMEQEVLEKLIAYTWPGNVRQLENAIEHAVALAKEHLVQWEDLPAHLQSVVSGEAIGAEPQDTFTKARLNCEAATKSMYIEALRVEQGDIARAAHLLGISRATFYRRLRRYGLKRNISKTILMDQ